jgi:hypothetical protein
VAWEEHQRTKRMEARLFPAERRRHPRLR